MIGMGSQVVGSTLLWAKKAFRYDDTGANKWKMRGQSWKENWKERKTLMGELSVGILKQKWMWYKWGTKDQSV